MSKSQKKFVARTPKVKATTATTYEIDIAQEFKDVKSEIGGLRMAIANWQSTFESKLTELNANMKGVLERLTAHDYRFTEHDSRLKKLEMSGAKADGHREGMSEGKKLIWVAAKIGIAVGALMATTLGCGWILKFLAII